MGLLKSKVFILLFVVLAFLVVAAVAGYYIFSIYSFNSFAKEIDSENQSLFAAFDQEVSTNNKIEQNLAKAMTIDTSFDKATNTNYLNTAKTDYEKSLTDYKKGVADLKSKSGEIAKFGQIPLWLTADQKKFAGDIAYYLPQNRRFPWCHSWSAPWDAWLSPRTYPALPD